MLRVVWTKKSICELKNIRVIGIIHSFEQNFGSEDFRIPISTFIYERSKTTAKPFFASSFQSVSLLSVRTSRTKHLFFILPVPGEAFNENSNVFVLSFYSTTHNPCLIVSLLIPIPGLSSSADIKESLDNSSILAFEDSR